MGHPETPPVEARCHFAINFTTRFHKLHVIRDSKIPLEQPLSLDGANPPEDLAYQGTFSIMIFLKTEKEEQKNDPYFLIGVAMRL